MRLLHEKWEVSHHAGAPCWPKRLGQMRPVAGGTLVTQRCSLPSCLARRRTDAAHQYYDTHLYCGTHPYSGTHPMQQPASHASHCLHPAGVPLGTRVSFTTQSCSRRWTPTLCSSTMCSNTMRSHTMRSTTSPWRATSTPCMATRPMRHQASAWDSGAQGPLPGMQLQEVVKRHGLPRVWFPRKAAVCTVL